MINAKELRDELIEICKKYPHNVNPQSEGTCQYDDGNGNHCLFGQWFSEKDLLTDHIAERNMSAGTAFVDLGLIDIGDYDLAGYADGIQGMADGNPSDPGPSTPVPWGELVPMIMSQELPEPQGHWS